MTQTSVSRLSSHSKRLSVVVSGLLILTFLSGCAAFPFVGPTCGPGEMDIDNLDSGNSTSIKGEVTAVNDGTFVIDDGTGEAQIVVGDVPSEVSGGDCIIARGYANSTGGGEYDAQMIPTELLEEELVIKDE